MLLSSLSWDANAARLLGLCPFLGFQDGVWESRAFDGTQKWFKDSRYAELYLLTPRRLLRPLLIAKYYHSVGTESGKQIRDTDLTRLRILEGLTAQISNLRIALYSPFVGKDPLGNLRYGVMTPFIPGITVRECLQSRRFSKAEKARVLAAYVSVAAQMISALQEEMGEFADVRVISVTPENQREYYMEGGSDGSYVYQLRGLGQVPIRLKSDNLIIDPAAVLSGAPIVITMIDPS